MEWFICTAQNIALKASDEGLAQSRCMLYYCAARFIAAHANPDLELLNDLKARGLQRCMLCSLVVHANSTLKLLNKMEARSGAGLVLYFVSGSCPPGARAWPLTCYAAPSAALCFCHKV